MLRIYQSGEIPSYVPVIDTDRVFCAVVGGRELEVEWFVRQFNHDGRYDVETHRIDGNYEIAKVFRWK